MSRTHQKRQSNQTWGTLFEEQHATLIAVTEMLLGRRASPEQILEEALVALEGSPLHRDFAKISAIRTVVKASISSHRKTAGSAIKAEASDDALKYGFPGIPPIGMLPWPERAVYFLREALRYSRRDIALLLRMSDASVDQLFVFAERRVCYAGETPVLSLAHTSELSREVKPNHAMTAGLLGRTA